MAGRLITLDASRACVVVTCRCGWRSAGLTPTEARNAADIHRWASHPRQAQYVASKRRRRAVAS